MNGWVAFLNLFRGRRAKLGTAAFTLLLASCGYLAACGYHVANRTDALPKTIHVIAVPTLENNTNSYRIEQKFTSAVVREFLAITPYKITSDPNAGDTLLPAKAVTLQAVPLLFHTKPRPAP